MSNDITLSTLVSMRTLAYLETQCPLYAMAGRRLHNEFVPSDATPMTGLNISYKEPDYASGTPNGLEVPESGIVGISDRNINVAVTADDIKNHAFRVNIVERDFEMRRGARAIKDAARSKYTDSYADPAASVILAKTEVDAHQKIKVAPFYSVVDDPEFMTQFNSERDVFRLRSFANLLSLPSMNQRVAMPDEVNINLAQTLLSRFNPNQNTKLTKAGVVMGGLAGMQFYETSGSTYTRHTAGLQAQGTGAVTTFAVKEISADGKSITFKGLGNSTLGAAFVPGDKIAIKAVKNFNRQSKVTTNTGYVATVTNTADRSATGEATITVQYPVIPSGSHRNVSRNLLEDDVCKMFPDYDDVILICDQGFEVIEPTIGDIANIENSLNMYGSGSSKRALKIKTTYDGSQLLRSETGILGSWTHFHTYSPFLVSFPSLPSNV